MDLNFPMNTTLVRGGTIFWAELVKQRRVIQWLCGFIRNHQYVSQSSLESFLIASAFVREVSFHCSSNYLTSRRASWLHSLIRLVVWRFSLTTSMMFFVVLVTLVATLSVCFNCTSQLVNKMSLWDSSIFGRSTLFPSSDSCQEMNYVIILFSSSYSNLWSITWLFIFHLIHNKVWSLKLFEKYFLLLYQKRI